MQVEGSSSAPISTFKNGNRLQRAVTWASVVSYSLHVYKTILLHRLAHKSSKSLKSLWSHVSKHVSGCFRSRSTAACNHSKHVEVWKAVTSVKPGGKPYCLCNYSFEVQEAFPTNNTYRQAQKASKTRVMTNTAQGGSLLSKCLHKRRKTCNVIENKPYTTQ